MMNIRKTTAADGAEVWELIRAAGTLDLNSAYCYLLLCDAFGDSCRVASVEGRLAGFVSAFLRPDRPDTLFVWQIAVHPDFRGQGIGSLMLEDVTRSFSGRIRYVEATVSPSNAASNRLFERFALQAAAELRHLDELGYKAECFPAGISHEDEPLVRIGPL